MRIAITLAAALVAAPGRAGEEPGGKGSQPVQAKGQEGQTADPHPGEHQEPKNTKGYGYGSPAGTEANAATSGSGQAAKKARPRKKAPQQEADSDTPQPHARAAEQGMNAGPMEKTHQRSKAKKGKKKAPAAAEPAGAGTPETAGSPQR